MAVDSVITYRLATLDDVPVIVRQRHGMFVDMGKPDDATMRQHSEIFAAWLPKKIESREYIGFVAANEAGENIAGAGLWTPDWPPHPDKPTTRRGYVMNVYVNQAYRRMGIARKLMLDLMDYCRKENRLLLTLHASDAGYPLYESLGFHETNEMRIEMDEGG